MLSKKNLFLKLGFMLFVLSVTAVSAAGITTYIKQKSIADKRVVDMTRDSIFLMQTIIKDYLYVSTGILSPVLDKEIQTSMVKLDEIIDRLDALYRKKDRVHPVLKYLSLGRDEFRSIIKDGTYTIDNVKLMLDLVSLFSKIDFKTRHTENSVP